MSHPPPSRRSALALLVPAIGLGLLYAWVDSRPTWDDTGITVGVLLLTTGALGALAPEHPWRWALAVGIWIPLLEIATGPNYASLIALVVAFIGAYLGMLVRRALTPG